MALQAEYKRGKIVMVTLYNGSGADLSAGDLVEDDGVGNIQALTDGGSLLGVCHEDIANGEEGPVELPVFAVYKVKAATGVDFGLLDPIYAAGAGEFDTGATGNIPAGWVVDEDPAAAAYFRAVLVCEKFQLTAHA